MNGRAERAGRRQLVTVTMAAVLAMLGVAACGDSGDDDDAATTASTTTTDDGDDGTSTTEDGGQTPTTTGTTRSDDGGSALPGEPWDGYATDGDTLAVVGVAHDDELNIRAAPGTDGEVVATAPPTGEAVATGEGRTLSSSFWYEVEVDGVTGWANASYLAFVAATDDATAELLDGLGGGRPEAETMVDLGGQVAEGFTTAEPASEVVQVTPPTVGDLGEVTFDVIGLGDDSVRGYRLHIFAEPASGGESFTLRTVERTTLCDRGTDGEVCL